jgi:hypothetical protein
MQSILHEESVEKFGCEPDELFAKNLGALGSPSVTTKSGGTRAEDVDLCHRGATRGCGKTPLSDRVQFHPKNRTKKLLRYRNGAE